MDGSQQNLNSGATDLGKDNKPAVQSDGTHNGMYQPRVSSGIRTNTQYSESAPGTLNNPYMRGRSFMTDEHIYDLPSTSAAAGAKKNVETDLIMEVFKVINGMNEKLGEMKLATNSNP